MRDTLTHAIEDYLKTIYDLCQTHGRATTSQIADVLEVKPASVTGMIQKLAAADSPLVEYQKHRGTVLTQDGEQIALEVIRHHRLLETFLHEVTLHILGADFRRDPRGKAEITRVSRHILADAGSLYVFPLLRFDNFPIGFVHCFANNNTSKCSNNYYN